MSIESVHAGWVKERVFLLKDHNNFPVAMSQPGGVNGADLLPMGLTGCAAWDVLEILQKQRQQVSSLEVSAHSEREEQPPWRFKRILIRYSLRGKQLYPQRVRRTVELAETKY